MMYEHTSATNERILARDAEERREHNPLIKSVVSPTPGKAYSYEVHFHYADGTSSISHSKGA